MTQQSQEFWFHAKRYGWGWGLPACWQGWAVLVAYLVLLPAGIYYFGDRGNERAIAIFIAVLTVAFCVIAYIKGEKPLRWRWGK